MKQDKIIQLLSRTSPAELKRFEKHIRLSFGPDNIPLRILVYLKNYHPHFDPVVVKKEVILKKVLQLEWSSKKAKRLSNEAHKLYGELLDFLISEKLKTDKVLRDQLIVDLLRERKLDDLFYKKAMATKKMIAKSAPSIWTMLQLFVLNHKEYYYAPMHKITLDIAPLHDAHFFLETFYELAKLKYLSEDNNRTNILACQGTMTNQNLSSDMVSKSTSDLHFLKELYTKILELNTTKADAVYDQLKDILFKNHIRITKEDQLIVLTYLINRANSDFREGNRNGILSAFELFRFGIEHQIFIESGFISAGNFRNIVFTACEVEALDWVEQFVETHQKYLVEEDKRDIVAIAKARIAFGQQDFQGSIGYLSKVDLKDASYKLLVKFLQVRCYYELNNKELCTDATKSFEQFLRREKTLGPRTLQSYQNFLAILRLLLPRKRNMSPSIILEKLVEKEWIAGKSWLQSKIAELS